MEETGMNARTLFMIILIAGTGLFTMACQKKHRQRENSKGTSFQKPQPSDTSCPANLDGEWKIGTTTYTLKFDTTSGQTKIMVPMGEYSLVDGATHRALGGS